MSPKSEFGIVSRLAPEALGVPGKRTFRVLLESPSGSAVLWLEKDQLLQLALAVRQISAEFQESERPSRKHPSRPPSKPAIFLEFKVGRLALGHDEKTDLFFVEAQDIEADREREATLRFRAYRSQMLAFAEEALKVCAAGRPQCPLCGGPMDPTGHVCVRTNGHRDVSSFS
ncbi:MAG: DUF3090 family protein [Chloroflexi bacterium]|nr:DUF3090 family protein [Chloroflexota bacterium]